MSCYMENIIEVEIGKYWIMKKTMTKPVSKPKQPLELYFEGDAHFDGDGASEWIEERAERLKCFSFMIHSKQGTFNVTNCAFQSISINQFF